MTMYLPIMLHLLTALGLGVLIGIERQWRQRAAGLRTNALVAVGAAAFVALATLVEGESSPTRIAAQVASGIGFLGAGVILREGAGIRGLNTAATLWGAASVGVLAGSGYPLIATVAALLVILSNVVLRPLAHRIDRVSAGANELDLCYTLRLVCQQTNELHVRALLVQMLSAGPLILRSLDSVDIEDTDKVRVEAEVIAQTPAHTALEEIVARLSLESGVSAISWEARLETE
jgi:putative Mg2+ transporter-C (MgtC) family protein